MTKVLNPLPSDREQGRENITFSSLGYRYRDYLEMGKLNFKFPQGTLLKVFDLSGEELAAIAQECGVIPANGINPNTSEGFQLLLLWMYLSGRLTSYGLNHAAKVEYVALKGSEEYNHRATAASFDGEPANWVKRLISIMAWPKEFNWTLNYLAKAMLYGDQDARYSILQNLLWNCGKRIVRDDYKSLDKILDVNKILYRKVRVCRSRVNLYCMWDRLRMFACHIYKGNKNDFLEAMCGAEKALKRLHSSADIAPEDQFEGFKLPGYTYIQERESVRSIMRVLKLGQ